MNKFIPLIVLIYLLAGCHSGQDSFTPSAASCTNEHINKFTKDEQMRDFLHAACSEYDSRGTVQSR